MSSVNPDPQLRRFINSSAFLVIHHAFFLKFRPGRRYNDPLREDSRNPLRSGCCHVIDGGFAVEVGDMSDEEVLQLAGIAWDALARNSLSRPANRKRSRVR